MNNISNKSKLINIKDLILTFFYSLKIHPKSIKSFYKVARRLYSVNIRYKQSNKSKVLNVIDEGFFHKIREIERNSMKESMTEISDVIFEYFPIPDVVVVVKASADNIFERRSNRNREGDIFSFGTIEKASRDFKLTIDNIEYIKKRYKNKLIIIEVNNDNIDAINNKAKYVIDFILKNHNLNLSTLR